MRGRRGPLACCLILSLPALLPAGLGAQTEPRGSALADKVFRHPSLTIPAVAEAIPELPAAEAARARVSLSSLGASESTARLDRRSGRFATLVLSHPLLPGGGRGNDLTWNALGRLAPSEGRGLGDAAAQALIAFLSEHREALQIEIRELGELRSAVHDDGRLIQIHVPRVYRGIPVRGSSVTAVINHGNLVLFGARRWATIDLSTKPGLRAPQARAALSGYLAPFALQGEPTAGLVVLPTSAASEGFPAGRGYRHRLVWALRATIEGAPGNWEALVDAHSGEVVSLIDINRYDSPRKVVGGVYPISNDGSDPEGLERSGYPMPFADVQTGESDLFTDSGGNLPVCVDAT